MHLTQSSTENGNTHLEEQRNTSPCSPKKGPRSHNIQSKTKQNSKSLPPSKKKKKKPTQPNTQKLTTTNQPTTQ